VSKPLSEPSYKFLSCQTWIQESKPTVSSPEPWHVFEFVECSDISKPSFESRESQFCFSPF